MYGFSFVKKHERTFFDLHRKNYYDYDLDLIIFFYILTLTH
jgi:hypothetical protein